MTETEKVAIHELRPIVRVEGDDLPRIPAETRLQGSDHIDLCPRPSRAPIRDGQGPVEISHCLSSIMTHQVHGQGTKDIQGKHPSPWTKGLGGSKIQKRYHASLTPLHRLLQAPEVSDQATARLLHQLKDEGSISLQRDIGILQAWLLGKTSKDTSLGAVSTHVRYEVLTEKTVVCNLSIRIEQFEEVRWGSGRLGKERTSVQRTCEPWETVFC